MEGASEAIKDTRQSAFVLVPTQDQEIDMGGASEVVKETGNPGVSTRQSAFDFTSPQSAGTQPASANPFSQPQSQSVFGTSSGNREFSFACPAPREGSNWEHLKHAEETSYNPMDSEETGKSRVSKRRHSVVSGAPPQAQGTDQTAVNPFSQPPPPPPQATPRFSPPTSSQFIFGPTVAPRNFQENDAQDSEETGNPGVSTSRPLVVFGAPPQAHGTDQTAVNPFSQPPPPPPQATPRFSPPTPQFSFGLTVPPRAVPPTAPPRLPFNFNAISSADRVLATLRQPAAPTSPFSFVFNAPVTVQSSAAITKETPKPSTQKPTCRIADYPAGVDEGGEALFTGPYAESEEDTDSEAETDTDDEDDLYSLPPPVPAARSEGARVLGSVATAMEDDDDDDDEDTEAETDTDDDDDLYSLPPPLPAARSVMGSTSMPPPPRPAVTPSLPSAAQSSESDTQVEDDDDFHGATSQSTSAIDVGKSSSETKCSQLNVGAKKVEEVEEAVALVTQPTNTSTAFEPQWRAFQPQTHHLRPQPSILDDCELLLGRLNAKSHDTRRLAESSPLSAPPQPVAATSWLNFNSTSQQSKLKAAKPPPQRRRAYLVAGKKRGIDEVDSTCFRLAPIKLRREAEWEEDMGKAEPNAEAEAQSTGQRVPAAENGGGDVGGRDESEEDTDESEEDTDESEEEEGDDDDEDYSDKEYDSDSDIRSYDY